MSKDNMYIFEILSSYFEARHFQVIPTDVENVVMYATRQKNNLYLINIIALDNNYIFDFERYEHYRQTTKLQFSKVPSDKIILLNILITDSPDGVYKHVNVTPNLGEDFVDVHWIVDGPNKQLVIPNKQIRNIIGLEKSIQELLTTGMQEFYELTRNHKQSHISLFLIVINVFIWIFLEYNGGSTNSTTLLTFGAINVDIIQGTGSYWRLFTAMFLHIGFTHLAYNVFALYIFGSRLEKYINIPKYLWIYIFSGLLGSIFSFGGSLIMGASPIAAGASGAIYGLLGAILVLSKASGQSIEGLDSYMMWLIFISGIVYSVVSPSVDAFAHVGGFVGGMLASAPIVILDKRQLGGSSDEER